MLPDMVAQYVPLAACHVAMAQADSMRMMAADTIAQTLSGYKHPGAILCVHDNKHKWLRVSVNSPYIYSAAAYLDKAVQQGRLPALQDAVSRVDLHVPGEYVD
eukprot:GHRR01015288.1.p3 GENE.GHRR01015288.1~~GHRR01015288.1.p3  ORF type:complete len:103 (+),score=24.79 GHRR01015288.1:1173-1481(+)